MAGERVDGAERDPEAGLALDQAPVAVGCDGRCDRRAEADRVALVVAVVDPDRIEACVACATAPVDDVVDIAAGGEPEADRAGEGSHRAWRSCARSSWAHHRAVPGATCSFALAGFLGSRLTAAWRSGRYRADGAFHGPRDPLVDGRPRCMRFRLDASGFGVDGDSVLAHLPSATPSASDRLAPGPTASRSRREENRYRIPSGAPRNGIDDLVAIGWATVDRERFWRTWPPPRPEDLAGDPHLGAFALRDRASGPGPADLVIEPDTEGRLAASLARSGEGPAALLLLRRVAGSPRSSPGSALGARRSRASARPVRPIDPPPGWPDLGSAPRRRRRRPSGRVPSPHDRPCGFHPARGHGRRRGSDRRTVHG